MGKTRSPPGRKLLNQYLELSNKRTNAKRKIGLSAAESETTHSRHKPRGANESQALLAGTSEWFGSSSCQLIKLISAFRKCPCYKPADLSSTKKEAPLVCFLTDTLQKYRDGRLPHHNLLLFKV